MHRMTVRASSTRRRSPNVRRRRTRAADRCGARGTSRPHRPRDRATLSKELSIGARRESRPCHGRRSRSRARRTLRPSGDRPGRRRTWNLPTRARSTDRSSPSRCPGRTRGCRPRSGPGHRRPAYTWRPDRPARARTTPSGRRREHAACLRAGSTRRATPRAGSRPPSGARERSFPPMFSKTYAWE